MRRQHRIDWAKLRRRSRRYWAISTQISLYFGVHTLLMTAIPLSISDPVIRPVALALYMGAGIAFDSFATALSTRIGTRRVTRIAGGLVTILALFAALDGVHGWAWLVLATLFSVCSSLLYIPGIAYFSNLLGPRQTDGQRIAVILQRGGALGSALIISAVLSQDLAWIMWWFLVGLGLTFGALSYRFPRPVRTEEGASLNPLAAMAASVSATVHSPTLMLALVVSCSTPLMFLLHGSVLPVEKASAGSTVGAAIGVGLVLRELLSVLSIAFIARGGFVRCNVEFIITTVIAGIGGVMAAISNQPWMVAVGIALGGPVVASTIVVTVLNVNRSAIGSFRPWAHFGAMGMSQRITGLAVPLAFGAASGAGGAAVTITAGVMFAAVAGGASVLLAIVVRQAGGRAQAG